MSKNRNIGRREQFSRLECTWMILLLTLRKSYDTGLDEGNPCPPFLLPFRQSGKRFLAFYAPPGKDLTGVFLDLTGASLLDVWPWRNILSQNAFNLGATPSICPRICYSVLECWYVYIYRPRDKYKVASGRWRQCQDRNRQVGKSRIPTGPFGRGHRDD